MKQCDMPERFEDWKDEARLALGKIEIMQDRLGNIHDDTQHLRCLPEMAAQLKAMNENLVAPATGHKRVDLTTHLISVGVLALVVVLLLAERFGASIKITEKGFAIERNHDGQ